MKRYTVIIHGAYENLQEIVSSRRLAYFVKYGYRNEADNPLVWVPYIPELETALVQSSYPERSMLQRYAMKQVNNSFYGKLSFGIQSSPELTYFKPENYG